MIRIIAQTQEPLLSMALSNVLTACEDTVLAGVASTPEDLTFMALRQRPDVALVSTPGGIDWRLIQGLQVACPETKIVLWVEEITTATAHEAFESGVRGILRRSLGPEFVLDCMRKVSAGEIWFEQALTAESGSHVVILSHREGQLVKLLTEGLNNREIARALSIAEGTVKVYLSRLFVKTGVSDRIELALLGLRNLQYGASLKSETHHFRTLFVTSARVHATDAGVRSLRAQII